MRDYTYANMASRVEKLRMEIDELTYSMQKFCIRPSHELFKKIIKCSSITRDHDNFNIWRLACLYKHGHDWGLESDPTMAERPLDLVILDFMSRENTICKKILNAPSQTLAMQLMHIFFALGELKHIELFYQCMGHEKLSLGTRRQLVESFRVVRDLYRAAVLTLSPEETTALGKRLPAVSFTYFDDIKKQIDAEKQQFNDGKKTIH